MVVPKLNEKSYLSISMVLVIVSLAFWTGKLDTRVERLGEDNKRQDEEITDLKKARVEADRLVTAQLNAIAQDVATIRGKLEVLPLFEIRDPDKRTRGRP